MHSAAVAQSLLRQARALCCDNRQKLVTGRHAAGDAATSTAALERVREAAPAALAEPSYHAWRFARIDSWRFRQDSMSYLRALYLCSRTELNLTDTHPDLVERWRAAAEESVRGARVLRLSRAARTPPERRRRSRTSGRTSRRGAWTSASTS